MQSWLDTFVRDIKADRSTSIMWRGAYIEHSVFTSEERRLTIKALPPESIASILKQLSDAIAENEAESLNGNLSG